PKSKGGEAMLERFKAAGRAPENEADVMWNFEKFLIGRNGEVVARFAPPTPPNDPALNAAIEAELAKPA
ncbi:MAG TPA: glutathione peroxidase, partial [Caulobacterales bacterium]|nr:glutathione peroxidase [Caulobacterales bacterium]